MQRSAAASTLLEALGRRREAVAILGRASPATRTSSRSRAPLRCSTMPSSEPSPNASATARLTRSAPAKAPNAATHEGVLGQVERAPRLRTFGGEEAARDRAADDAVAIAVAALDREREEDPRRASGAASRFASPRCASASVSTDGTRSGPRGRQHRPGDEAAAAEHGVAPCGAAGCARRRSARRRRGRARARARATSRRSRPSHVEAVERVAGAAARGWPRRGPGCPRS